MLALPPFSVLGIRTFCFFPFMVLDRWQLKFLFQMTKALEKIRKQILQNLGDVKDETERVKSLLLAYNAIGPEFDTIVERYAKVQDEIDGQRWAIKELQKK